MKKLLLILIKSITIRRFLFISFLFTMSSCMSLHSGYITNSVALSSNNFEYLNQSVTGNSEVVYVLVFGGYGKQALVTEAFNNMKEKYPINKNQVYTNLSVNFKHSIMAFGFFREIKCTVSADIVEFQ